MGLEGVVPTEEELETSQSSFTRAAVEGEPEAEFSDTDQELAKRLCHNSVCYTFQLCHISPNILLIRVLPKVMKYPFATANQLHDMGIQPIATRASAVRSSISRETKILHIQLGKSYPGPVGA